MIPISKPVIGEEEKKAVLEILNSGMLAQGPKVKQLEEDFAKYCGIKHAIATSNGTTALHAAVYALGIKPGDEVITIPFTFVASANSILMQGAKPVFVDIEPETFMIDPEKIEAAITQKTKAILPVDLYGQIYDYKAVKEITDAHGLKIIEDACQAIGAELNNKKAGNFGDAAAFSLYATKNMMTGEGGIITTDDDDVAELIKRFRHHGQSEQTRYQYFELGYNYRMTDLHAAIGIEQLKKLEYWTEQRIKNAAFLTKNLKHIEQITTPFVKPNSRHVFHQYTIKVSEEHRDKLMEHLKSNEVGCGIYYPKPLHLHPSFEAMGYKPGMFPVSEKLASQVLSLPVHPMLTEEELKKIVDTVGDYFA